MAPPGPYYEADGITIYCGDCREILPGIEADVMVTDPPYGISYSSGYEGALPRSVVGDGDTALRDWALAAWSPGPMACFAAWHQRPPWRPRGCLVWDKGDAAGMGDLDLPWRPNFELVWIFGHGWAGYRGSSVLRGRTIPTWNSGPARRVHPTEKPMDVLTQIIEKAPLGAVLDPFMGSGTTLVAAKLLGRRAIGIEIEERYCEVAVQRLAQGVLPLEGVASGPIQEGR